MYCPLNFWSLVATGSGEVVSWLFQKLLLFYWAIFPVLSGLFNCFDLLLPPTLELGLWPQCSCCCRCRHLLGLLEYLIRLYSSVSGLRASNICLWQNFGFCSQSIQGLWLTSLDAPGSLCRVMPSCIGLVLCSFVAYGCCWGAIW